MSTTKEIPDLLWRAQISGLLRDLSKEVLELSEIVIAMNEKLEKLAVVAVREGDE